MKTNKNWTRFWNLRKQSTGGFTLVELIVVIAILAILAGVAVPAYSGYIKKANEAGDLQILGAINTAFAAALIENNLTADNIVDAELTGTEKTVQGVNVTLKSRAANAGDVAASFARYLGSAQTFKVYELSDINYANGTFYGPSSPSTNTAYNTVLDKLLGTENSQKLQNLVNSVWGDVGAQGLTDKVDWTSDIATEMLAGNSEGSFADMIGKCGDSMMEFMGITDPAEQAAKAQELAIAKMNQLIAQNPEKYAGLDAQAILDKSLATEGEDLELTPAEEELFGAAQNSIAVNNAILTAAKSSQDAAANIKNILSSENPKSQLISSVNAGVANDNTDAAMGEVALAYAMYMSYAERNNIEVKNAGDVLAGLNDSNFKDYVNNTDGSGNFDKDMQGYLSSMDMINNSVKGNEQAVTDVVLNGFGNTDLVNVLNQAMNSAKSGE